MGMYWLQYIGTGGEGPGLKPDDLSAIYRGLKPAATPETTIFLRLSRTLISDALH
jgi:hypothetical protein